jgi:Ca2+:H+ antiporter
MHDGGLDLAHPRDIRGRSRRRWWRAWLGPDRLRRGPIGAVIAAVHHAEVVAHRVGEPFGTLLLAVAVTVIEVSLILSLVIAGGDDAAVIPRDTIYAAVMIICNGVVGICILVGGLAHHEQTFRVEGSSGGLAALIAMSALALVLPDFTTTTGVGTYSKGQLAFAAVTSTALWAIFVFVQTVRHRDYFLPAVDASDPEEHARHRRTARRWRASGAPACLAAVVDSLACRLHDPATPSAESDRDRMLVLRRSWAVRAARANRPDQHEPGHRLSAGEHRAHDPRRVIAIAFGFLHLGRPRDLVMLSHLPHADLQDWLHP